MENIGFELTTPAIWAFFIILFLFAIPYIIVFLHRKTIVGDNDDIKAADFAMRVIDEAKKRVVMYDDGKNPYKTIYGDEKIANSLIDKLKANNDFTVEILFNDKEGESSLVAKKIIEWRNKQNVLNRKRAQIRVLQNGDARPDDAHFKMADDGHIIYVTYHEVDCDKREFVFYDEVLLDRIRMAIFGKENSFPFLMKNKLEEMRKTYPVSPLCH